MANQGISEKIQSFIFNYIDSVELLEVLLFLHRESQRAWTAKALSAELRANPSSVARRLETLNSIGLAAREGEGDSSAYRRLSKDAEQCGLIDELDQAYRIRRSRIIELIFSPAKKARPFADAFTVSRSKSQKDGSDDGNDIS